MKLGRLNHVGVATPSIEKSLETYRAMFGAEPHGEPFNLPAIAAFATAEAELNCCAAVTALANAEPYFAKFANDAWFFAMIAAAAEVP